MLLFTDPDYKKVYDKLPVFVCLVTQARSFIVGKCASISGMHQRRAGDYVQVHLMNRGADRFLAPISDDQLSAKMVYDHLEVELINVIDPDHRDTKLGIRCDNMGQALLLPRFLPNRELTQEMIEAWSEMVREETADLHAQVARLQAEITDMHRAQSVANRRPKNRLNRKVNPQRRINLDE